MHVLLSIGESGIHIKSLEGIHIASPNTKGSAFSGAVNYIRTINKVLKIDLGERAPQLMMDMLGNQRITWKLAGQRMIDEAFDELNEGGSGGSMMSDMDSEDESPIAEELELSPMKSDNEET